MVSIYKPDLHQRKQGLIIGGGFNKVCKIGKLYVIVGVLVVSLGSANELCFHMMSSTCNSLIPKSNDNFDFLSSSLPRLESEDLDTLNFARVIQLYCVWRWGS